MAYPALAICFVMSSLVGSPRRSSGCSRERCPLPSRRKNPPACAGGSSQKVDDLTPDQPDAGRIDYVPVLLNSRWESPGYISLLARWYQAARPVPTSVEATNHIVKLPKKAEFHYGRQTPVVVAPEPLGLGKFDPLAPLPQRGRVLVDRALACAVPRRCGVRRFLACHLVGVVTRAGGLLDITDERDLPASASGI